MSPPRPWRSGAQGRDSVLSSLLLGQEEFGPERFGARPCVARSLAAVAKPVAQRCAMPAAWPLGLCPMRREAWVVGAELGVS